MLARFLEREIGELRAWEPMDPAQQRFWQLLKRCAALVRCKVQLNQSLVGLGLLQEDAGALVKQCEQMIGKLDRALLKQSGRWQGRCKLTKKGDGEVRRLLYNAAMQGRRSPQWEPYYLRLRGRGMSSTAALVALSRKLAKVSFALLRTDAPFVPAACENACVTT